MKILSPLALSLAALLTAGCGNALKSDYRAPQAIWSPWPVSNLPACCVN